jgi:hypothetical protein
MDSHLLSLNNYAEIKHYLCGLEDGVRLYTDTAAAV